MNCTVSALCLPIITPCQEYINTSALDLRRLNVCAKRQKGVHKMNTKRFAQIKYEENFNGKEGYAVYIKDEEEDWGLDTFYPLTHRKNADVFEDANFISFRILNKINELIQLKYKIVFL